jgi:hypothetical protein
MSFDELPPEIVERILDKVTMGAALSTVGDLNKCHDCRFNNFKCKHMSPIEYNQITRLMKVCKLWYELIQSKKFVIL